MPHQYPWALRETAFGNKGFKRGDNLPAVKHVQEWLTLHGFGVLIDGAFGPASEAAVKAFQKSKGLDPTGIVDKTCYDKFTEPLLNVLKSIKKSGKNLGNWL